MRYISVLLATVACGVLAAPALAQEPPASTEDAGIDDIIVTAQKREQNLQDVPVAVTAVTGAALEAKGITQFEDLTRVSPGLTITRATTTPASSINLRGIGTYAFSIGVEPSVAVVVDDLAVLQQAQAFSNLSDVERIEVLRGPQGTLFGKGASAGAVNLVTRAPSSEMQGSLTASATTDEQYRVEGTVSGPLSEAVGFRLSGFYGHSGGYIRNLTNGTDLGRDRSWGLRGRLKIQATDALTFDLMASHAETRTNGTPRTFFNVPAGATVFGAPLTPNLVGITPGFGNDQIRINTDPDNTNLTTSASLRATLDLGPVNLISITGYQDWKYSFREDVDGTASLLSETREVWFSPVIPFQRLFAGTTSRFDSQRPLAIISWGFITLTDRQRAALPVARPGRFFRAGTPEMSAKHMPRSLRQPMISRLQRTSTAGFVSIAKKLRFRF